MSGTSGGSGRRDPAGDPGRRRPVRNPARRQPVGNPARRRPVGSQARPAADRPTGAAATGDPPLPADVDPRQLDPAVAAELRGLPRELADRVAARLVAAGQLLEDDPALALAQARVARRLAARIRVVREACGFAAYAAGEWSEALAELRAAGRLGDPAPYLPVVADCERALGRPERALAALADPSARRLDPATRAELLIVASGARRDLGQPEAAVLLLRGAPDGLLDRSRVRPWSGRLWYAYADALLAAGRETEAVDWFAAAAGVDGGETDAAERVHALLTGVEIGDDRHTSSAPGGTGEPADDAGPGWSG